MKLKLLLLNMAFCLSYLSIYAQCTGSFTGSNTSNFNYKGGNGGIYWNSSGVCIFNLVSNNPDWLHYDSGNFYIVDQNECDARTGTISLMGDYTVIATLTVNQSKNPAYIAPYDPIITIIKGKTDACVGDTVEFSVPNNPNLLESWIWTVPSGYKKISESINILKVKIGLGDGIINCKVRNECGVVTGEREISLIKPKPPRPKIIGATSVCKGETKKYKAVSEGAVSFSWTVPSDWNIVNGQGTDSLNVIIRSSGDISAYALNSCGGGYYSNGGIWVNVGAPGAGSITGSKSACGGTALQYIVKSTGATTFNWTLPTDWTIKSGQGNDTINVTPGKSSGYVCVVPSNQCLSGTSTCISVTITPKPAGGSITGATNICPGQGNITYTVIINDASLSYVWSLPSGAIGSSATKTINVSYTSSAQSGNIIVTGKNSCGSGPDNILAINANQIPAAAGPISGATTVCKLVGSQVFTVESIANATSYEWTLPFNAQPKTPSYTNTITVVFLSAAQSGYVKVKGLSACGGGTESQLYITVSDKPAMAGTITGNATVCQGQTGVVYSVDSIPYATSYVWSLPSGATGNSQTKSIKVDYASNATYGYMYVHGKSFCGSGYDNQLLISVKSLPAAAASITGNSSFCRYTSQAFSVATITGANSYVWTTAYGTIKNTKTNTVTITFDANQISGNLKVHGINNCGTGTESSKELIINEIPATPTISTSDNKLFTSSASIGNQWYWNGAIINGATQNTYTATKTGTYYTKVKINNCTSSPSNSIYTNLVGLNDLTKENMELMIYPNPASNSINIYYPLIENKEAEISIYDMMGKQVLYQSLKGRKLLEINTTDLSNGIYFLKIQTNAFIQSKRIVIRRTL